MIFIMNYINKKIRKSNKNSALPASLTIEAALALPIFMLFTMAVVYLLVIISLQTDIQLAMEEAARSLGKQAYLTGETDTDYAISTTLIKSTIFTDELKEEVRNSNIRAGISGVSAQRSDYDEETGILDIVLTYTYEIPYLPESINRLRFIQRIRSRAWIGEEISGTEGESSEGRIVYITPSGTVYHTTTSCPYLDLSVSSIDFSSVSSARNRSGSKYTACTTCCKNSSYTTVYITDYGTNYHSTLSCTKLKRTVLAVDISEVDGRKACSKCGGE